MNEPFTPDLIAPCGMNCGLCKTYLAYSRGVPSEKGKVSHCSSCRVRNKNCAFIKKNCEKYQKKQVQSCLECDSMPCKRLAHLAERYHERYGMSMVENLKEIKADGMDVFLSRQREKYKCSVCGDVVSVHDGVCYKCKANNAVKT